MDGTTSVEVIDLATVKTAPASLETVAPEPEPEPEPSAMEEEGVVRAQALVRGQLTRVRWRKLRLLNQGRTAWRSAHDDSKQWVVRPKLVLELLQHDHFRSSGLVWLSLYLLFLAVFIATTVQAQRGNIYYELEMGLLARFGPVGGGAENVASIGQTWDYLDSLVGALHEDSPNSPLETAGSGTDETDWSAWQQFEVDAPEAPPPPPPATATAGALEAGDDRVRTVATHNRVVGGGLLISQRRRPLAPSCWVFEWDGTGNADEGARNANARCVGSGEDTAPFNGTQSGARYNWVEECGCFPAGVFGALGNGTTLAQDRSRLAQLRRDGWLGPQTAELTASLVLVNPSRQQTALLTAQFSVSDSGWVSGSLTARSSAQWAPFSRMAPLSLATVLLWFYHFVSEILQLRRGGCKEYCTGPGSFSNLIGLVSLVTMLGVITLASLGQRTKKDIPAELDAAYAAAAAGGYGYELHSKVESLFNLIRLTVRLIAVTILLMLLHFLKYFRFSRRLSMLSRALSHAGEDLLWLGLSTVGIVLGFGCAGHIGFGNATEDFATLPISLNTLMLWTIGSIKDPPGRQHDASYTIFFWLYIVLAYFIIVNVLLSIIVDSWATVKEEASDYRRVRNRMMGSIRANKVQRNRMYSALGGFDRYGSFKKDPTLVLRRCIAGLGCWSVCVQCKRWLCCANDQDEVQPLPAVPTPGALSPDTLEALRGFSFERLQRLLLLAIRDVHKNNDRDDV